MRPALLLLFLLLSEPVWATESEPIAGGDEPTLSEEEVQLLELLELLQNYEMLDEIDILAEMEEEE